MGQIYKSTKGDFKMRKRTADEINKLDFLKLSELAEYCGVRYSTVKYYCELGLLPFEQKGARLAKYFPRIEAGKRLNEILKLRKQGRAVPEVINHFIGAKAL